MDKTVFGEFSNWVDEVLGIELPQNIVAFNFNLYEGDEEFHIQLIGSDSFSIEDEDWACDAVFSTEEDIFILSCDITGEDWQQGLSYIIGLVKHYLDTGKYSHILKASKAVGVGFVDGDIEVVYQNE